MTGGVPSVQHTDDALSPDTIETGAIEDGLAVAAAEHQFEQSQLKAHEMQAALARAVEAGEFDGGNSGRRAVNEAALLRVLSLLESAKDQLDRVRLRG